MKRWANTTRYTKNDRYVLHSIAVVFYTALFDDRNITFVFFNAVAT